MFDDDLRYHTFIFVGKELRNEVIDSFLALNSQLLLAMSLKANKLRHQKIEKNH